MIRIGTPVTFFEDGILAIGTVTRTSINTGRKLYRVGDRWIDASDIMRGKVFNRMVRAVLDGG